MKSTVIALVAALCLAACAKAPSAIGPTYVSEVPYQAYTCEQLGQESVRLNEAYTVAAKAQEDARTGDTWGVILIGVPVSTLSGSNLASEIGSLKGQMVAVQKTMITKNCGS